MAGETKAKWVPPVRRRIYLMRHGDVDYFDATGKPARVDQVPLNDRGRLQAEAARLALAEVPLDRVIASDLRRSVETASIVAAGRGSGVETFQKLREIEPGRLAQLPAGGAEKAFLGAFASGISRDTQFLGGERIGTLMDRVLECFHALVSDVGWRTLLIVAHGGVNRVILTHALGLGLDGFGVLEQDPACINILDVGLDGRWLARLVNHTPYNPSKIGIELTTMEQIYVQYLGEE